MLHIFRGGKTIDAHGQRITFDEKAIAKIAASYNATRHEAPIVVGHPTDNAPAYGWIKRLVAKGLDLYAVPHQVEAQFSDLVKAGRYKNISISLYRPDSPSNPVPGVFCLRHVGFLGAMPPAIKGLKTPVFSENTGDLLFVNFGESPMDDLKLALGDLMGSLMAALPEAIPQEQIDALMSAIDGIDLMKEEAVEDGEESPEFSERSAKLEAREKALKELEKGFALKQAAMVKNTIASFAEEMCKAGKMTAGEKPGALKLLEMAALSPVDYSEGGKSALELQMDAYRNRKALLNFSEVSADSPSKSPLIPASGIPDSTDTFAAATKLAKEKGIDYAEAVYELFAEVS